ncbi:MAG: aminomethyl-transferring glycine dehydrogenase [Phycisphaerales bacterium]|nr:aminomethyl-transferring glycine dehydrogenase [Phycisphaerales bacterium]
MSIVTTQPSISTRQAVPTPSAVPTALSPNDTFPRRHIGPDGNDQREMLRLLGFDSLDALTDHAVPDAIQTHRAMQLSPPLGEYELLQRLQTIADKNDVFRSCIGMGYHGTITPGVILRNVLENPLWYTQYTPYQAEISQGRLEALLNFQTMVADLTGLPLAGASLLDEATAAAEAMGMCFTAAREKKPAFFASDDCHPQTISVMRTRAESLGIELIVAPISHAADALATGTVCGVLVQVPNTFGAIECYQELTKQMHDAGALMVCAADLLSLTLIRPPGEWGADIVVGSAQRFGVPMGLGGPHAAFIATKEEHTRRVPGRIIGVSKDAQGNVAYRMALQTREQHIRREKATSNICTAQALLAIMAGFYGAYHGPDGLRAIATRIRTLTQTLRRGLLDLGCEIAEDLVFDTLRVKPNRDAQQVLDAARSKCINLRDFGDGTLGITLDETSDRALLADLLEAFGAAHPDVEALAAKAYLDIPPVFARSTAFMQHAVFNRYHCETEMLRYITQLQSKDLSLAHAMIPLGSCTMKLNATTEMQAITWPAFAHIHPFAPREQWTGYAQLFKELEAQISAMTDLPAVSLQPNAGAQGEYAGLLAIRAYHLANLAAGKDIEKRDICLIPTSAHGTNPASAVMAGMRVVAVACDAKGNIDLADLRAKAEQHATKLAAVMITYPSTHGVFERNIKDMCKTIHDHGGLVYMDGANLNAQLGLTSPGAIGADVCHLNLHKTFCIPHGGGGPGMGPIAVAEHLAPYLPGDPLHPGKSCDGTRRAIGPVAAAPYGSALILTISWAYIAMMGAQGLKEATQVAILNANYMAKRLREHFDILYTGPDGLVAHEFILDCRPFEKAAGVKVEDIAKRLMDYSFHGPTMSWPVPGTLMVEPTESESRFELDRFCDAMIAIRKEIDSIERGEMPKDDNPLIHAPHTMQMIGANDWPHVYSRESAAWPVDSLRERKFWPACARVDNAYGDRNLFCTCPGVEEL